VGEKRHFSILFGFPLECAKQVKKSQNISFLFLAIHLASPLEILLGREVTRDNT